MSFALRIKFTGILGFVPDKPFTESPSRVYVLAPDGEVDPKDGRRGADAQDLSRHRAFIKVNAANVVGTNGVPSSMESLWYIGKRELRLETTGASAGLKIGDLSGLASLGDVAPLFSKVHPDALQGTTPPTKLGARFVIDAGTLRCGQPQGKWVFPNILCSNPVRVDELSNEVFLELAGLESLAIAASPLTGGDTVRLQLTAPAGGTVELIVANLCDENPLEWPGVYDAKPDLDFRWYFELLSDASYAELTDQIDGLSLPYPCPQGKPNARGADCFPAAYPPPS
jgi:hypothetical protein